MTDTAQAQDGRRDKVFKAFKYTVYFLLFVNIFFWLREDYLASAHLFPNGVGWDQLTVAFSQATDMIAWVILLFMFELETAVISDERLNRGWKWVINGVAGVCYFFVIMAFLGYVEKFKFVFGFDASALMDACAGVGQYASYAIRLDEYATLTAANCSTLIGPLFSHESMGFVATSDVYASMQWLAVAEVLNAGTWILIVLLLWADVFIQLRGMEHGRLHRINIAAKFILYSVLFVICIYWGFEGDFLDFWDAFLWITAFFVIELNIFKWSEEIEAEHAAKAHAS